MTKFPVTKKKDIQRDHLLERYVSRRLREGDKQFTNTATRHWLTWLAARMVKNGLMVFHLEGLQPFWLPTSRRPYQLAFGMVLGLAFALALGLAFGPAIALAFAPPLGLTFALVFGLDVSISPVESMFWAWRGLAGALAFSLASALAVGLVFGPQFGLAIGLAFALALGVTTGLTPGETVETRTRPNQGIRRSLVFGVSIWLAGALALGLALALAFGPALALVGALQHASGQATLKHYTLRFLLWRANHTPRPDRYVAFLDYAAERQLLRKVGGGYIFRHRLLQEYFAGLETPQP